MNRVVVADEKMRSNTGEVWRKNGHHQEPVFSIEAQGSWLGNGSFACSNSIEIPSGERTKAI